MAKPMQAPKFVSDGKGGVSKAKEAEASKPKLEIKQTGGTTPKPVPAAPKPEKKERPAPVEGKKLTYEARMRQLVPIERVRRKLAATVLRFKNLSDELATWKNAADLNTEAKGVLEALEQMADVAKSTPDDFKPERDRKARESHLKPGAIVSIREKAAEQYEGVIDTAKELEVIEVRKGRVVCKTADGEKVFIPRGHLTVSGQDEDEEDTDEGDEDEA